MSKVSAVARIAILLLRGSGVEKYDNISIFKRSHQIWPKLLCPREVCFLMLRFLLAAFCTCKVGYSMTTNKLLVKWKILPKKALLRWIFDVTNTWVETAQKSLPWWPHSGCNDHLGHSRSPLLQIRHIQPVATMVKNAWWLFWSLSFQKDSVKWK